MSTASKVGRPLNSKNTGYFFRTGRGWYANEGKTKVPLRDANGAAIKDKAASQKTLRDALLRHLNTKAAQGTTDTRTVQECCDLYIASVKNASTLLLRGGALFDFCTGLPASFWQRPETGPGSPTKKEILEGRLHDGFGHLTVAELLPLHAQQWVAAHPDWHGGQRAMLNSLRRAMNYCKEMRAISVNPLRGMKVPKDNVRNTYVTPEQEANIISLSTKEFALAVQVLIRTGARYGIEFCALEARHVTFSSRGMEWKFAPHETKTKKTRILRIQNTEPEAQAVCEIVRELVKKYPEGGLFRTRTGRPWTRGKLQCYFKRLRERLAKQGMALPAGTCPYSFRHTYAKRTLQGFWTGKPTNIETLCKLMGNSREICWKHYSEWCETYTEPLWDAS